MSAPALAITSRMAASFALTLMPVYFSSSRYTGSVGIAGRSVHSVSNQSPVSRSAISRPASMSLMSAAKCELMTEKSTPQLSPALARLQTYCSTVGTPAVPERMSVMPVPAIWRSAWMK